MREDRHGRARRTDGDRRRRPVDGFRARGTRRFEDLVEDALSGLPVRHLKEIAEARLALEAVPPTDAVTPDGDAVLGRLELRRPRTLVLYRRAIELRAGSRAELTDVIRDAAGQAIGMALGWPRDDWDWEDGD